MPQTHCFGGSESATCMARVRTQFIPIPSGACAVRGQGLWCGSWVGHCSVQDAVSNGFSNFYSYIRVSLMDTVRYIKQGH